MKNDAMMMLKCAQGIRTKYYSIVYNMRTVTIPENLSLASYQDELVRQALFDIKAEDVYG